MKNKKETYVSPKVEVILIKSNDIVTISLPEETLEDEETDYN